ncbi:hypothetical protein D521_0359 [beta proteobacterium CB]|nr:hypothetical protein D521_0359 [beta proteobacterium CB]
MKNTSRLGKMPAWQRYFVFIGILSCSLTGIAYLLGHEFHIERTVLGAHSVLVWHGIAAMAATMALGSVLPFHLKAGLKSRRKLWSGLSQLAFLTILLASGALLYYGPEEIRDSVIEIHWMIGLTFFAIFLLHGVYANNLTSLNAKKAH